MPMVPDVVLKINACGSRCLVLIIIVASRLMDSLQISRIRLQFWTGTAVKGESTYIQQVRLPVYVVVFSCCLSKCAFILFIVQVFAVVLSEFEFTYSYKVLHSTGSLTSFEAFDFFFWIVFKMSLNVSSVGIISVLVEPLKCFWSVDMLNDFF